VIGRSRLATALALASTLSGVAAQAWAGGLFLPGRGVRPIGRGGAFTAGADDLGAIWYDPAGMALAVGIDDTSDADHATQRRDHALLVDDSLVGESVAYTRVDSGGNTQPTVHNNAPPLPPPTLAYAQRVGDTLAIGAAVLAPYGALADYPLTGPQRYSMVSLVGSLFLMPEIALAWHPVPHLYLGAGLQDLIVKFEATVVTSGCPNRTVCAPEDPDFDSPTQMNMTSPFNPSGNFGAIYTIADDLVRIGAALQLPFWVNGGGTANIRLPNSAFYNSAQLNGNQIQVAFTLPLEARAGLEVRPLNGSLRLELEFDYERWSMQNKVAITPKGITITGVPGIGTYTLGELDIIRDFVDTYAVHLGVEWQIRPTPLTLRAGYAFETGAAPLAYFTVATPDGNKHLLSVGASYEIGALRIDVVFAYAIQPTVTVTDSASLQIDPVRDSQPAPVGNGTYSASTYIAGAGISYQF
jgi:long-chain fatty acid transport protein